MAKIHQSLCLLICCLLTGVAQAQYLIELKDGKNEVSVGLKIAKGQVSFNERTLSYEDLSKISQKTKTEAPSGRMKIELVDGTILFGKAMVFIDKEIHLQATHEEKVIYKVKFAALKSLFLNAGDADLEKKFEAMKISTQKSRFDRFFIRNSAESLDYLEGTLMKGMMLKRSDKEVPQIEFLLSSNNQTITPMVAPGRCVGILFNPAGLKNPASVIGDLKDFAGNSFAVSSLSLEADNLKLETPAGLTHELGKSQWVELDLSRGNWIWLSDIPLKSVNHNSDADIPLPAFIRNIDRHKKNYVFDEKVYKKSLTIIQDAEVSFKLSEGQKEISFIPKLLQKKDFKEFDLLLTVDADGKKLFTKELKDGAKLVRESISLEGLNAGAVITISVSADKSPFPGGEVVLLEPKILTAKK